MMTSLRMIPCHIWSKSFAIIVERCNQITRRKVQRNRSGVSDKNFAKLYIDDLNTSVENYDEGLKLYKKTKLRFFEGNFNVRKWRTNHEELR